MLTADILDVTQIEPKLKHPTIFQYFDRLNPGESFVIYNDHDPKPLYYQLLGERGNIFTWEYLEQGPQWWRVKIAKNPADAKGNIETVGEIAAKDYRKAEVFKKYGIDFCCGGEKSLKDASIEAGISEQELKQALEQSDTVTTSASQDYNKWGLDFLADYIQHTHHQYVKDNAEVIHGLAQKVAQHHGEHHPELHALASRVTPFLQDLLEHVQKEEAILFPMIKQLVLDEKEKAGGDACSVGAKTPVSQPIETMHEEHQSAGDDLKYFREITQDYTLPADACNSYTYLFEKLKEFEDDLFRHIHLENNILFPKAIALEKTL